MFKKIILTIAVLVFTASYSSAGNVQTFGIGAKATAQSEAVSAYADDPFAVYYNPAGLVLSKRPVLSTGFMAHLPEVKITNFKAIAEDGTDKNEELGYSDHAEIKDSDSVQPHIGYSMPINEKFFFGIAAYSPYGMHVKWDKNPVNNPGAAYAWESYYGRMVINPSVAYKVNDKLSFGFGVSLGKSVSEAGKTVTVSQTTIDKANLAASTFGTMSTNDANTAAAHTTDAIAAAGGGNQALAEYYGGMAQIYTTTSEEYAIKAAEYQGTADLLTLLNGAHLKLEAEDSFNYSFNAGVMYRPVEEIAMGLTYRGRTEANFKGDTIVTGSALGTLGGSVTMDYDHPESIQGGVRYFATKNLSLEFDMTWTRWSILTKQVENITINTPGGPVSLPAAHDRDWEDTIQYKIGAEWNVIENVALRGGYTYDPTPVPDHTFDIGWPDTDRSVFNIGCGWGITENWVVDSVVQYVSTTPTRKIRGESAELAHTYESVYGEHVDVSLDDKGTLWGLGVTVSYLF